MVPKFEMFNKQGMVMMKLSRELLTYSQGDRIDTISTYTKRYDTSRGVVQEVLNALEKEKAIVRTKRGTLGTFLSHIDYKKLWEFTSWGVLSGVSPLPYTRQHEGIATAIYNQMEKKGTPFHFAYMQGAKNRVLGVLAGKYDFAVLGKGSAKKLIEEHRDLSIAMEFAPYSYLSGYVVLYKDKAALDKQVLKVGRDLDSPDHNKWLELLGENKEIEYVDIQYTKMVPAIMDGSIDITIYNKDTIEKPEILANVSYEEFAANQDIGDETRAVLVVNNKSYGIFNLLNQSICQEQVDETQKQVIEGIRVPVY